MSNIERISDDVIQVVPCWGRNGYLHDGYLVVEEIVRIVFGSERLSPVFVSLAKSKSRKFRIKLTAQFFHRQREWNKKSSQRTISRYIGLSKKNTLKISKIKALHAEVLQWHTAEKEIATQEINHTREQEAQHTAFRKEIGLRRGDSLKFVSNEMCHLSMVLKLEHAKVAYVLLKDILDLK